MDDTRIQIQSTLFEGALSLPDPAVRAAFLAQVCRGDPELLRSLESLLDARARAESFFDIDPLNAPGAEPPASVPEETDLPAEPNRLEGSNARIGRYKLIERLGEGGCGVVYLAEQQEPVRRQVALKIIRLGMDTERVIARFEMERQALAMMNHPNIAQVLDAGTTQTGRPFFVMELVRGVRITDYCDQHALDLPSRLKLFIEVCLAIQHAHQKGILHRDIKPSNILVVEHDGKPVPKVIDFGIAKAIETRPDGETAFTAIEQLLGTPAYMSPEQIQGGADVDTRSDIYSLGVVLYELLAGRPPFDTGELLRQGPGEMRRVLCEVEPPRPSVASGEPRRAAMFSGDLDWIVMKALDKERERRYHTARGFALDIEHYLRDEPVQARPPSRFYRLQKLVRRNKATFVALGAIVLALVAGFGVSTWLFVRASNAEHQQTRLRIVAEEALSREANLRRLAEEREKISHAAILINQNKWAEADAFLTEQSFHLTQPSIEASRVFKGLAEWNVLHGNLRQAAQRLLALIQVNRLDENNPSPRDLLLVAPALIEAGDIPAYENVRRDAIARLGQSQNAIAAEQILKISMLLPADKELLAAAGPLARVARDSLRGQTVPKGGLEAWRSMVLAMFEYRQGHDQTAWDWAQRSLAYPIRQTSRDAVSYFVQAMAAWRMQRPAEARLLLQRGRQIVEERAKLPLVVVDADGSFWFDWIDAHIMLREAQALIQ